MPYALLTLGQVSFDGDFFAQLPSYAKAIFIAIIILLILSVIAKYVVETIAKFKESKSGKKKMVSCLADHSFFSKCESWSKYKINELHFGDDTRNRLFRVIIGTKIEVIASAAKEALTDDINEMSKEGFTAYVSNMITKMHVDTQASIRNKIIEMYPTNGIRIYELVMNHELRGFNAFNQITDNYTEKLVQIICQSDIYCDNCEKYEVILDAFKASLGVTFPHIEATFRGFNGELDAMTKKQ